MIMFHSLQLRFLITSAIAYRLLVYLNLNARLKNLSMRSRYFTLICHSPNLNSVQKQGHNVKDQIILSVVL